MGTEKLKPISWSVWAGEIEKEGGAKNPFRGLEDRVGFWNVRVRNTMHFLVYFHMQLEFGGLPDKLYFYLVLSRNTDALHRRREKNLRIG